MFRQWKLRSLQNLKEQIMKSKAAITSLKETIDNNWNVLRNITNTDTFDKLKIKLRDIIVYQTDIKKSKLIDKLSRLYGATMYLPNKSNNYNNLSKYVLTEAQKEVLNLGLNCHLQSKFDPTTKLMELEVFYSSVLELQKSNKLTIKDGFEDALKCEGHKNCVTGKQQHILTPLQRSAAKELFNNEDIIVRKADKSNIFIILDRDEYTNLTQY